MKIIIVLLVVVILCLFVYFIFGFVRVGNGKKKRMTRLHSNRYNCRETISKKERKWLWLVRAKENVDLHVQAKSMEGLFDE